MKIKLILAAVFVISGCASSKIELNKDEETLMQGYQLRVTEAPKEQPTTIGGMIANDRVQQVKTKVKLRQEDCTERAQFASIAVQMRDNGVPIDELDKAIETSWSASVAEAEQQGNPIPSWYKLEFRRIVETMKRTEPKNHLEFARKIGKECVQFGPWMNPEAR